MGLETAVERQPDLNRLRMMIIEWFLQSENNAFSGYGIVAEDEVEVFREENRKRLLRNKIRSPRLLPRHRVPLLFESR